jgi:hypothetical protein
MKHLKTLENWFTDKFNKKEQWKETDTTKFIGQADKVIHNNKIKTIYNRFKNNEISLDEYREQTKELNDFFKESRKKYFFDMYKDGKISKNDLQKQIFLIDPPTPENTDYPLSTPENTD